MHSTGGMRWTLSLVVLAACTLDEPSTEIATSELGCTDLICGGNGPIECALSICELDGSRKEYSRKGFKITKAWRTETLANVPVFTGQGAKIHSETAGASYDGPAAVGTSFQVDNKDGQSYELQIYDYKYVWYYDGVTDPNFVAYHVRYRHPGMDWQELCPFEAYDDHGIPGYWAMFWNGDRIDDSGKIIATNEKVGSWFNISCAGEAAPKAARMKASGAIDPATPSGVRQAALYFFTADYCGNGTHYTILGHPIQWKDETVPDDFTVPIATNEAIWSGRGAVCLDTPRYAPPKSVLCDGQLIPSCGKNYASWSDYGSIYSANPFVKQL